MESNALCGLIESTGASLSKGRETYGFYFGGHPPRDGLYRVYVSPNAEVVRWFVGGQWNVSEDAQPMYWTPIGELMNVEKTKWWWELSVSDEVLNDCEDRGHTCFMSGDEAAAIKIHGVWVQFLRALSDRILRDGRETWEIILSKKRPTGLPSLADIPFPAKTNSAVETR